MGKSLPSDKRPLIIWWLGVVAQLLIQLTYSQNFEGQTSRQESCHVDGDVSPPSALHLFIQKQNVIMSNGIVNVTLNVPDGMVTSITYKGSDNLLEPKNAEYDRGMPGTSFKIITQTNYQTELSFSSMWRGGASTPPLNIDKRFVMLRDSPGFYTYAVVERLKEWPAFDIQEGRFVLKLKDNKFHYMAMSDERQRIMPTLKDRETGQELDYKEAVLLTNPSNVELKGEVDDKYLYSCDNKDNRVHGWVSNDYEPVGLWMITPSNEFKTGGPFKQDLTSHVGPVVLSMFISTHYAGEDIALKFETGEYWKKVLGPVYVYLNSDFLARTNPSVLWNDAKQRMLKEKESWPYNFPGSGDFIKADQRGAVTGQLLVRDWYKNKKAVPAVSAYVGLAPPGPAGSWQLENKGYQFWTQTDNSGNFLIKNVIPGTYSLFAYVPGYIGDYKHSSDILVSSGSNVIATSVVFEAPRKGPTLWEMGIPDRTAAEFFIPNPSSRIFAHHYSRPVAKFRQYGLWARYNDLYPVGDLVYTVGKSDYRKEWFFEHVNRKLRDEQFAATTWQIEFDLKSVISAGIYTVQLALASANEAELQVLVNDPNAAPQFTTGLIGRDNAIARHGIHGLYHLYSIDISGYRLVVGKNTIFLKQARSQGPFRGVMYDYIRFEGPA
ncbi:rhamnogalacturonate lyase family protein [Striga asiatica]|uniref:rhamnogalacturonan endolyase n=1 Tax=Striga asiatica TaxID=4170 RepID=A0A5A7PPQ5_STRAF|nr:rhamnogalacturonate lyase family protein [Striga asiatica]